MEDKRSLYTFIRSDGNAFTRLEDLSIDCFHGGVGVPIASSGRLRRLYARIPFFSWEERKRFVPWEQLTSLEIECTLDASIWVPLFAQCVNLENAIFDVMRASDHDPIPTVNVTMARLTSLSVKFLVEPSSTQLFDGFRFPVLTSLHMEPGWTFPWRHSEHFHKQLSSLRTFTFVGASEHLV